MPPIIIFNGVLCNHFPITYVKIAHTRVIKLPKITSKIAHAVIKFDKKQPTKSAGIASIYNNGKRQSASEIRT